MRIGYACLTVGVNNIHSYRTCTTKTYNEQLITEIVAHNLDVLLAVLKYNVKNRIKMFRISSDIIPLASHPINTLNWQDVFKEQLTTIGDYIKVNDLRVSMHPGQYTVLNSINEDTVQKSISDLSYHCNFLDCLGLDSTHKIVLHVGGVYGDKVLAMKRFEINYLQLDEQIKKRLVIENDDKLYNIEDVLSIATKLKVPVIFDNLHHQINKSEQYSEREWIEKCLKTWKTNDGVCKLHYSNQHPTKRVGAHSEFIFIEQFMNFYNTIKDLQVDIMLEVKDKNLSAIKCINTVTIQDIKVYQKEWAKYKYVILERNHNVYKELRQYLKLTTSFNPTNFYLLIEQGLNTAPSNGSYRNGFDHAWGYFKKQCTPKELETYKQKLCDFNNDKIKVKSMKSFLCRMANKYQSSYLLQSYYFTYE